MKKILQRCIAGLLTALLCAGGVYAAETVTEIPTISEAAEEASILEWGTTYTHTLDTEMIKFPIFYDPEDTYQAPGVIYSLGTLVADTRISYDLTFEEVYDEELDSYSYVELYFLYKSDTVADDENDYYDEVADNLYSFQYDPYYNHLTIPDAGEWYVLIKGSDVTTECSLTVNKYIPMTVDEAFKTAIPAAPNASLGVQIGTQYIKENDIVDGIYPGAMFDLGVLSEEDVLELTFETNEEDTDPLMILYYQTAGMEQPNIAYTNFSHYCIFDIPLNAHMYVLCLIGDVDAIEEHTFSTKKLNTTGSITTLLDFTSQTTDNSSNTDHWDWKYDAEQPVLTLHDGFSMISMDTDDPAIMLPANTKIVVKGDVNIVSVMAPIWGEGDFSIHLEANAKLNIKSHDGIGINDPNMDPVDLTITGADKSSQLILETFVDGVYAKFLKMENLTVQIKAAYDGVDVTNAMIDNCDITITSINEGMDISNDLTIKSSTVHVTSYGEEGLDTGSGDVKITDSTVVIDAKEDAIDADDNIIIDNSTLTLTSAEDTGLYTDDKDITITNSTVTIHAYDEAIAADNDLAISDSTLQLTVPMGKGIYSEYEDVEIANSTVTIHAYDYGIEADEDLEITNSTVTVVSETQEGLYSPQEDIVITDSTVTITAGDEGIEADDNVTITNSKLDVTSGLNPIEGTAVSVATSALSLVSTGNYAPIYLSGMDRILQEAADAAEAQTQLRELFKTNLVTDTPIQITVNGQSIPFTAELLYVNEDNIIFWSQDEGKTPIDFANPNLPKPEPEESTYDGPPMPNLYALNVQVGEGGTANASGNLLIAKYATRNLRFTPNEGYEVSDVLVNDISIGAVNSYKVGPAVENTTVEVRFAPIPVEEPVAEAAE